MKLTCGPKTRAFLEARLQAAKKAGAAGLSIFALFQLISSLSPQILAIISAITGVLTPPTPAPTPVGPPVPPAHLVTCPVCSTVDDFLQYIESALVAASTFLQNAVQVLVNLIEEYMPA